MRAARVLITAVADSREPGGIGRATEGALNEEVKLGSQFLRASDR